MPRTLRLVVLGIVGVCALTLSSTAFAAFSSPRLFASQPEQPNRVDLLYTQSTAEDPVAKVTHFVPVAYRLNLAARPVGTQTGTAILRTNLGDRNNQNLVLSGVVEVVAPTATFTRNGQSQSIAAHALACTGTATHSAYFVARLRDAGGDITYDLPIYVDRLSAATAFDADATITTCFQAPDVAASDANRAPLGLKVREFSLNLIRIFTSPQKGQIRWSTLATPFTPRSGRANSAGTVELQSVLNYPRVVSLRPAVRVRMTRGFATFRFTGIVTTPALDRPTVSLFRGAQKVQASSRSAQAYKIKVGAGNFTKLHTIRRVTARQSFYFQVRAFVPNQIQGRAGCAANFHPNVQCIQTTRAGYMIRSRTILVRVPAR